MTATVVRQRNHLAPTVHPGDSVSGEQLQDRIRRKAFPLLEQYINLSRARRAGTQGKEICQKISKIVNVRKTRITDMAMQSAWDM